MLTGHLLSAQSLEQLLWYQVGSNDLWRSSFPLALAAADTVLTCGLDIYSGRPY